MSDRIRCGTCGSESYAGGATLHCATCFQRLKAVHDKLLAENASLHGELARMKTPQPCGHPQAAVVVGEEHDQGEFVHWCDWCADLENGKAELARLEDELRTANDLLETRMALVDAIPECPEHGPQCVPHAIEWVKTAQATITSLENARDAAIDDAILAGEMLGWE